MSSLSILMLGHTQPADFMPVGEALEAFGGQFLSLFFYSFCTC